MNTQFITREGDSLTITLKGGQIYSGYVASNHLGTPGLNRKFFYWIGIIDNYARFDHRDMRKILAWINKYCPEYKTDPNDECDFPECHGKYKDDQINALIKALNDYYFTHNYGVDILSL